MSTAKPVIFGCLSLKLSEEEKRFFHEVNPLGFILFARNINNPKQVADLIADFKSCVSHDKPLIMIDQEGGRVARLTPPHWAKYPASSEFVAMARDDLESARQAVFDNYKNIATELVDLGINVDCAPVLDIPAENSDAIIGNRAFGDCPNQVTILARAACDGLLAGGVMPMIKHIPGHGRANVDSHLELPVVDCSIEELEGHDFIPFRNLNDIEMAMTAHIKYSAIDNDNCCTMSPKVINVIRNNIGFKGLLFTDDLSMHALKGSFAARTRMALSAGCDVILHCNGEMDEMREIADNLG